MENYHTFFITELGLMVHNIDCKNATLGQIFKQVGDNISDTKIKGDFEDVIKKLDDIAGRNNIEEYIKNFDSRFRGLDPNNLDEIKKIISDTSKDIDNHSSSLFKGTEGVSKPKPYSKNRPSYRKGQVDEVWENAKDTLTGKVYDPTGKEITWDKTKPRNGQWDMGHIPGEKYSEIHELYMDGTITKKEFLEWYKNSKNYRPELPSTNRGHKYE